MISRKHAELRLFGSNGWNAACLIKLNEKHADGQNGPLPGSQACALWSGSFWAGVALPCLDNKVLMKQQVNMPFLNWTENWCPENCSNSVKNLPAKIFQALYCTPTWYWPTWTSLCCAWMPVGGEMFMCSRIPRLGAWNPPSPVLCIWVWIARHTTQAPAWLGYVVLQIVLWAYVKSLKHITSSWSVQLVCVPRDNHGSTHVNEELGRLSKLKI